MYHYTADGFNGYRSRFDDIRMIYELLEEIPNKLNLQKAAPPFILPYYNGVIPEDCGISAFIFLTGGHFTIHTFSFRETFFADLVYSEDFDNMSLTKLLATAFPCNAIDTNFVNRENLKSYNTKISPENDFGPHYMLNLYDMKEKVTMDHLFEQFDSLPSEIGMTPIMRPFTLKSTYKKNQVISILTMIAESHISLHYFPETNNCFFDMFSCRFFDEKTVLPKILKLFPAEKYQETLISRGSQYNFRKTERSAEYEKTKTWLNHIIPA